MNTLTICLLSTLVLQTPPAGQTGNKTGNNQNNNKSGVFNPGTPPGPGRMPPDKDGGNRQPLPPGGPNSPGNPNLPGGPNGSYNVMVDGTYAVLAYDKFGQALPGMAGIKVVIRNNILTFPGDTKNPGKMLQLSFGPANTISVTPLDGTRPVNTNPNSPWNDGNSKNGNAGQQGGNIQQGGILPQQQSEFGVYVLSNEYFAISIVSSQVMNNQGTNIQGTSTGNTIPPGDPTRTGTGVGTGGTSGGDAARRATGSGTGSNAGTDAARNAAGTGSTANDPARNAAGNNNNNNNNAGNGQMGNNNDFNPRLPQPGPSQAVLVLRKVAQ